MWSDQNAGGMFGIGTWSTLQNQQNIGAGNKKFVVKADGGLQIVVKNKEPIRDLGSSADITSNSFTMLKETQMKSQSRGLLPAPTTGGNGVMIFGQTEWSSLWADKIYQFTSAPGGGEAQDKNCGSAQQVLRNPVRRLSLPAGVQIWENGQGEQRFETGKVQQDIDIRKHDRGQMNIRTVRNDSGVLYDKGIAARDNATGSLITRERFNVSPGSSSNDSGGRRIQRKMRFENNTDLTSSGGMGQGKKKRVSIKRIRSIVVDGTNVAYTYGENWCFDWEGIQMCVKFFKDFGCDDIIIVIPENRMERGMARNFDLQEILKKDSKLWGCWANTNYRQFIAKTADRRDAIIISNEMWKQPSEITPNLRHLVDKTIGFHFNQNVSPKNIVISERPFGPSGPTLDELLRL